MEAFGEGDKPKALIRTLSESLLAAFAKTPLLDPYDLYQHLMSYWSETMEDDAYLIAADGWVKPTRPVAITDKKSKETVDFQVGRAKYRADFLPSKLLIAEYFATEQAALDALETELASLDQSMQELAEEHTGDEGLLADATTDAGKLSKASATARLKLARREPDADPEELRLLDEYLTFAAKEAATKTQYKSAEETLMRSLQAQYQKLDEPTAKRLLIEDKWMAHLRDQLRAELDRVSQRLTGRVKELSERYAKPLPGLVEEVEVLNARVNAHLEKMGAVWN